MEDHKKEIDADFTIVQRKNMRRGKPQQRIYIPGSGKLRRSDQGTDDNVSESGSTRSFRSGSEATDNLRSRTDSSTDTGANSSFEKREKKPERKFYIPRPIAQAREQLSPQSSQNYGQESDLVNGTDNSIHKEKMYRSKRYSSNRSHGENNSGRDNSQNEWRDKSPNRNYRMGSEPRGGYSNGSNWSRDRDRDRDRHRERDTRSVEPTGLGNRNNNFDGGKFQMKPPSGRRHSTTGNYLYDQDKRNNLLKNLGNIAPRFRKKFMEENGLTDEDLALVVGGSAVQQTTSQQQQQQQQQHQNYGYRSLDSYNTLPHTPAPPTYNSNLNSGYHTMPNRPRGRARFVHPEPEFQPGPPFRAITPDRAGISRSPANSRPGTPTRRFDSRPPSRPPSRSQTPLSHYDDNRYSNESWGDRGDRAGSKPNAFDRLGGSRPSEPRHFDRERDRTNDYNRQHRDDGFRRRGEDRNRRNESERRDDDRGRPERDRKDSHRRGERNRRGGREKRSSSRDFVRQNSKESSFSNQSNRTVTGENWNENRVPPPQPPVKGRPVDFTDTPFRSQRQKQTAPVPNKETAPVSTNPALEIEKTTPEEVHDATADRSNEDRDILDWNEEIELDHRLEAEAFSDAMTRSSSMGSLQEISTRSMPTSTTTTPNTKKKRKSGRRKSKQRSGSSYRDKTPTNNRERNDSLASIESRDNFKVPHDPGSDRHGRRRRGSSREQRDASFDRFHNKSRGASRDVSFDRNQSGTTENWREEIIRSRQNSEREGSVLSRRISSDRSRRNSELEDHILEAPSKKGGILVLPSKSPELPKPSAERPKFPEVRTACVQQKTLFDPKNPSKPILVNSPGGRVSAPGFSDNNSETPKVYMTDSSGRLMPAWYNESSDNFNACHFPDLLKDIRRADLELQYIINHGFLLVNYETVDNLREFLKQGLEYLLCKAIKFCQTENVEQHIWNILYYNIIEITRKAIIDDPDNKPQYKGFLLYLIDEGTKYFEGLIGILEDTYDFKVVNYIGNNCMLQHKGLGFTGLALVSVQKIFMFLGNLGRYREQVNETSNYGKCRQWYIKSHEINPKNGKPYNQLAVLAVCSRRKLDAVYYYMRSLMSSNPVPSAKENLSSLFDENRKKYEQGERKRREERLERQKQHMKQKESEENGAHNFLRKETWIHPEGGRRLHRTTKALQEELQDSEEEDLASLSSVDVNKRFVTSYLHVQGKLITNIGLESFQDAAMQMLKEFRALLQHSPVSLPCNRFLQLLALNMFSIESTQLKDPNLQQSDSYRSELQERALIVSLQMFNLILERCVSILQDHVNAFLNQEKSGSPLDSLPHDANVLLPAIKVWCDWMLCHPSVWNPPPSTQDFKVGPSGDLWSRLGVLMNILERMDQDSPDIFIHEAKEGFEPVRLPEDATLCGFTPLILHDREVSFAPLNVDSETSQLRLRVAKLIFFGTVYLCGLEPPVLKLEIEDGRRDYVSVVCSDRGRDSPREVAGLTRNDEVLLETFSDDEEASGEKVASSTPGPSTETSSEVQVLLSRKLELEKTNRNQELRQQQVMKILSQSVVSVHLEIRPKYLVPDTNCFIDHLNSIQTVAKSHTYTLMVPIVVLSELEGLSKGTPSPTSRGKFAPSPDHVQRVAVASRLALEFLKKRHATVKCVTTKGAVLASTTFSTEDDATWDVTVKNDDKILATCLVLCKNHGKEQQTDVKEGEPRHLFREVVLLTEDRNLRVKALARDVPVRALPDFMRWAGLGG